MKRHIHDKKRIRNVFCIFIVSLCICCPLCQLTILLSTDVEKSDASHIAQIQAGKIQNALNEKLQTAKIVSTMVLMNQGDISNLEKWFLEIVDYNDIASLSIAPNGVISNTYPLEGNESTIGHDIVHDPSRATETLYAIESGKLTLSGPYHLKQGYFGLIGRLAIYFEDENGQQIFWGLACINLKLPDALKKAELNTLSNKNYHYNIWRTNPDTGKKETIDTSTKQQYHASVTKKISLPNSTWYLTLYPTNGWIPLWNIILRYTIALLFSILISLLYWYVHSLAHSRNNLRISMEQQSENYLQMNVLNEKLRNFRHDVKNHMLSIANLIKKQESKEAIAYIEEINKSFIMSPPITNTENYVFDAMIAEKKRKAEELQITMECEVHLSRTLDIENLDWTILLGNALDNAIEASQKVKNNPIIRLQVLCRGNILHVKICNSYNEEPKSVNGNYITSKQNSQYHGQGIKQMENIVQKYHGTMEINYENHLFTISFMLCEV